MSCVHSIVYPLNDHGRLSSGQHSTCTPTYLHPQHQTLTPPQHPTTITTTHANWPRWGSNHSVWPKHSSTEKQTEQTLAHVHQKQLPEDIICNLLGLSGLGWDCCNELPTIWQQLHQQSDQKGWDVVICKFFQKLGKKCPDLKQFHSSTLFDHIINHKFLPGELYDTCHHGLSILAISLCSFTVQELKQCEDDIFQWASNITPDALWKH